MALTEKNKEYTTTTPNGTLEVKNVTEIYRDGVLIATQNHRSAHEPGDDVSTRSDRVKSIAATVWTKEVVDAHRAAKASQVANGPK